jgi:hypothetical protein
MPGLVLTVVLELVIGLTLVVGGVIAGLRLRRIRRGAVTFTKQLLVVNAVGTIATDLLPFLLMPTMTEAGRNAVTATATTDAQRALTFGVVWFLYLTYSKQVRELFPRG